MYWCSRCSHHISLVIMTVNSSELSWGVGRFRGLMFMREKSKGPFAYASILNQASAPQDHVLNSPFGTHWAG